MKFRTLTWLMLLCSVINVVSFFVTGENQWLLWSAYNLGVAAFLELVK